MYDEFCIQQRKRADANLFVEKTEDHRGYYYREGIVNALAELGRRAKDGAHLFLDSFRKKIEHVGHWRKDEARREWVRIPIEGDFAPDLDGLGNVPIPEGRHKGDAPNNRLGEMR